MRGNSNFAVPRATVQWGWWHRRTKPRHLDIEDDRPTAFPIGRLGGADRRLSGYRNEEAPRRISVFCLEWVGAMVVFAIVVAVFVPFGILFALVTKELSPLYMIPCLGGIIGSLMGIGQVIIDRFSDGEPDPHEESRPTWGQLADFYPGAFSPWWMKVVDAIGWVAHKDFSEQEPGRWKRGLIAAAACAPHPALPDWLCRLDEPHASRPGLFPAPSDSFPRVRLRGRRRGGGFGRFRPSLASLSRLECGRRPRRPTSRQGHIDRGGDGVTSQGSFPEGRSSCP